MNASDAEVPGVILVICGRAVAVLNEEALSAGVVVDVGDDVGRSQGAADVDGDGLQHAAEAEGLGGDAGIGRGLGADAAEGVVGPGCREGLGLEQGRGGGVDEGRVGLGGEVDPVGRGGVVFGEAAFGGEEVALEVVLDAGEDAGAVINAVDLAEVVGIVGAGAEALAVDDALLEDLVVDVVFEIGVSGAVEVVVGPAADVVAAVPGAQRGAESVGEGPAGAGVLALGLELQAAGGEGVGLGGVLVGVGDDEAVTLDVEGYARGDRDVKWHLALSEPKAEDNWTGYWPKRQPRARPW
ncbi:hypothetical protein [Nannocystis bainbridge]|uniref:Uncharacterized protein n=1 Tax=Nannocystis bainbridge TaxID=2995303 RepID=A0ABT5EB08_9BACT|nr:hypothetical protein [Nannocystis bainbridge]MDC0721966.1 hypothetical protein [Nannocystis bainbridge]